MEGEIVTLEAHLHPMAPASPLGAKCQLTPPNRVGAEQRFHHLDSKQPSDFSFEGKESVQHFAHNNHPKAHLIHRPASSRAAKSIYQSKLVLDVPSQETSNQWWGQSPLGADNTTDSLSDGRCGESDQRYFIPKMPKLI